MCFSFSGGWSTYSSQGLFVNNTVSLNLFPVYCLSLVLLSLCYVFFFRSKKCSSHQGMFVKPTAPWRYHYYLFSSISASVFSVVPVVSLLLFCCLICAMCSFSGQRSAVVKVWCLLCLENIIIIYLCFCCPCCPCRLSLVLLSLCYVFFFRSKKRSSQGSVFISLLFLLLLLNYFYYSFQVCKQASSESVQ